MTIRANGCTTNCTFKNILPQVPRVETVGYGFWQAYLFQHCPRFQPWGNQQQLGLYDFFDKCNLSCTQDKRIKIILGFFHMTRKVNWRSNYTNLHEIDYFKFTLICPRQIKFTSSVRYRSCV